MPAFQAGYDGSIPLSRSKSISYALLVQLDRIPDYGSDDEDSSSSRGTD